MKLGRARLKDGSLFVVRVDGSRATPIAPAEDPLGVLDALSAPAGLPAIGPSLALEDVQLLAPIAPPSLRDFVVFEAHLANIGRGTNKVVPPEWYEGPAFYFSNTGAMYGPDEEVRKPKTTDKLDFEVELACVVGRDASDLDADDPSTLDVIAGFLIFNDLSARDLQAHDQAIGVGPGKGKDFANCIGPLIVTPDEVGGFHGGRTKCAMSATVNGQVWTETGTSDMHYTWGEILAAASVNTTIRRGDVIAAGTCPRGCIAELLNLGEDVHWLVPGDVVEIAADGIGTLINTIT
jgi:fumarylacetoacetate (FAA) hydrolase